MREIGRLSVLEADTLQRVLAAGVEEYLLLCEHPPTFTSGTAARPWHLLNTGSIPVVPVDRGGGVTYHGPGQLVGYPIWTVARIGGDPVALIRRLEAALISACSALGVAAYTVPGRAGVYTERGKIAAIGMKVAGGRTRHGFALNITSDLSEFSRIIPCGVLGAPASSLRLELGGSVAREFVIAAVLDALQVAFPELGGFVSSTSTELARPVGTPVLLGRRPSWLTVRHAGTAVTPVADAVRAHGLVTVCVESACPNRDECWMAGTATFMLGGRACTRACTFCQVQTARPASLDADEPSRVAAAVAELALEHVVLTMVARDDLADGAAAHVAATIYAVRLARPSATIEVLISDLGGDADALEMVLAAAPDVLNHNLETVSRLSRTVRPQGGYGRSLALLARARGKVVTKSGLMVGLGETPAELSGALTDLAAVGVEILSIGQYLPPSPAHAPLVRYVTPDEFAVMAALARSLGFAHVAAGPLVRSSYEAAAGLAAARQVGLL